MADKTKQEYYQTHKQERLEYQRKYYRENRKRIKRSREIRKEGDPEWVGTLKEYNRRYYLENKERIKVKRADSRKRAAHTQLKITKN